MAADGLQFIERMRQIGAKTLVWDVKSSAGQLIGQVRWHSYGRGYAFFPVVLAQAYHRRELHEISDFIEDQTSKYWHDKT